MAVGKNGIAKRVIGPDSSGRTRCLASVTGIHGFQRCSVLKDVDGRGEPGHDVFSGTSGVSSAAMSSAAAERSLRAAGSLVLCFQRLIHLAFLVCREWHSEQSTRCTFLAGSRMTKLVSRSPQPARMRSNCRNHNTSGWMPAQVPMASGEDTLRVQITVGFATGL